MCSCSVHRARKSTDERKSIFVLDKSYGTCKKNSAQGLDSILVDMDLVCAVVISTIYFASRLNIKGKVDYVIFMAKEGRWTNKRCFKLSRAHCMSHLVIAADVHIVVPIAHCGVLIQKISVKRVNHIVELLAYMHYRAVFNVMATNSDTTEHQIQTNVIPI